MQEALSIAVNSGHIKRLFLTSRLIPVLLRAPCRKTCHCPSSPSGVMVCHAHLHLEAGFLSWIITLHFWMTRYKASSFKASLMASLWGVTTFSQHFSPSNCFYFMLGWWQVKVLWPQKREPEDGSGWGHICICGVWSLVGWSPAPAPLAPGEEQPRGANGSHGPGKLKQERDWNQGSYLRGLLLLSWAKQASRFIYKAVVDAT